MAAKAALFQVHVSPSSVATGLRILTPNPSATSTQTSVGLGVGEEVGDGDTVKVGKGGGVAVARREVGLAAGVMVGFGVAVSAATTDGVGVGCEVAEGVLVGAAVQVGVTTSTVGKRGGGSRCKMQLWPTRSAIAVKNINRGRVSSFGIVITV